MFDLWGGNREENIREAKNMVLRFRQYNDLQEGENTSRENIEMYKAMIEDDLARKQKSRKKSWFSSRTKNKAYPSIVDAHHTVDPRTHTANLELKEELAQIKAMLQEAKKDVSSYKCPTAKVLEQNSSNL